MAEPKQRLIDRRPPDPIFDLLKTLASAYPDRPVPRETLKLYVQALQDVPAFILHRAVIEHIQESPWFPRISELRQRAVKIAGTPDFFCLPDNPIDFLRAEEDALWEAFDQAGELDIAAMEGLLAKYERLDRLHVAESLRKRLEFFAADPEQ
ncbi:MAG TPA: hypothetical protein VLA49_18720 [Anaerolineales bacterium]|nr:hypothetical protein [Anaerolineales bacterium]